MFSLINHKNDKCLYGGLVNTQQNKIHKIHGPKILHGVVTKKVAHMKLY